MPLHGREGEAGHWLGPLGGRAGKSPSRSKAASSPDGFGKFFNSHELRVLHTLDDHLCNSIAAAELDGLILVCVKERHSNFTPVTGVYRSGSVNDRQAMLCGQTRTRMDQSNESVWQGD